MRLTQDINIEELVPLITPNELLERLPMTEVSNDAVFQGRAAIKAILSGEDSRLLVVAGPCSIHDPKSALEYAQRLSALRERFQQQLCIIMRVYFEKPRTTVGWKGLLNDPYMNGSCSMSDGLHIARQLLLDITGLGLPVASEVLDPIAPQYIADLISWAAVGARTTESQTHREMASGLSMPVGFKNGTDGSLEAAMNAMEAARHPHSFIGITKHGSSCIVKTRGNPWGHAVLRGGKDGSNYDRQTIEQVSRQLTAAGLPGKILVDCSHANSLKRHENQRHVWHAVLQQCVAGNSAIMGMMLESHLKAGNQSISGGLESLTYGMSITDACIDFETTQELLAAAWQALKAAPDRPAR